MKSPRLRQTVFRLKISSFLAFSTFEKGFLWHSRWGGGVTRANFCITRGSLSWLVAPRDAKIGTRDTTPSPLVPQKALFKGLEGPKDWFSAEKQFALPQTFHVVLTNIIKYYCYILSLLAKWNMIFCLNGAFLENSLSKQNFPSPHMLAVCMQGEGESLSFFSQASCTVHGFA